MGFGGLMFGFVGAVCRWIYGSIWRTIAKKKKFTFREYINGPDNSDDWFDLTGHGLVNRIVGMIILIIIACIIVKLG